MSNNHRHHSNGKNKRLKRTLLIILLVMLGLLGSASAYAYYQVHHATSQVYSWNKVKTATGDKHTQQGKPVAYLMLGTDTGDLGRSYKGRTDTMIVTVLNPKTKKTTMMSIPRDTKIDLYGATVKINSAYAYGNAKSAISAVEKLLDIKLDGYIMVNMGGLTKLVDSVGGVDVESPLTFTYGGNSFTKGQTYHLNGDGALNFSRMRHEDPDGDYGRQRRQQLVIAAIMKKVKNNPTKVMNSKFLNTVAKNVRTDVSLGSVKNLVTKYRSAGNQIVTDQMKGQGKMIRGESFEVQPASEIKRAHSVIEEALK